jgi:D-amino-acid oxidase
MAYPEILVIGAGVSGLTTAVCLAEAGLAVRILSQHPPLRTTSAAAGASWGPYLVEDERVLRWSTQTRLKLQELAADPASGIRLVHGLDVSEELVDAPPWALDVPDFRMCRPEEVGRLPRKYTCGWRYTIPLVDMPVYLQYLTDRLKHLGVELEVGVISSFTHLIGLAGILVNCTGLGAQKLVPDRGVFPTRGQVVVLENPGVEEFFQDNVRSGDPTYILPHGSRVVLGGCATRGAEDPQPSGRTRAIIERCSVIEPALARARFIESRVGLRPSRYEIRTECVDLEGTPLIHNYGHGGGGVTLSWGCAQEVHRLVHHAMTTGASGQPLSAETGAD